MERITRWFVHNSVASNMVMIFVIIAGALTIPLIKMEVFPAIEVDIVNITTLYPGASPGDVRKRSAFASKKDYRAWKGSNGYLPVPVKM